ncbi:MAG: hypothetical protein CVU24_04440 [Betaproteobacteria bacterium HGW-Betaproteobacteria-18]|nr:MAG: hypothetical protein CVU24_04440 [Betaproteobacteria bacterium HGW-Betaproteobacteria-18]
MADDQPELKAAADAYFRSLPGLKYPQALMDAFPRIANTIFDVKDDQPRLRGYFDSLIKDARGGRRGFPFDVLMDIQELREVMVGDVNYFVVDDTTKWVS